MQEGELDMSKRIKKYLAVIMTIAIVASGINDFSFIARADSVVNENDTMDFVEVFRSRE